jgi:agmatine/peptidylarginine deiminase
LAELTVEHLAEKTVHWLVGGLEHTMAEAKVEKLEKMLEKMTVALMVISLVEMLVVTMVALEAALMEQ